MTHDPPAGRAHAVMTLLTESPMYPGCGADGGAVDLPVDRERHTGWPILRDSAAKGALREAMREHSAAKHKSLVDADGDADLVRLFGKGGDVDNHGGALSVGSFRPVLLPVRSLRGTFARVTCPRALAYLREIAALAGIPDAAAAIPKPGEDRCVRLSDAHVVSEGERRVVVLEEYQFEVAAGETADDTAGLAALLAAVAPREAEPLSPSVIVLHDDAFDHFARYALEVVTRNALDLETRTVGDGALFTQELIPADTLLAALVTAERSRERGRDAAAGEVLRQFADFIQQRPVLQFAGDASLGRGLCWSRLVGRGVEGGPR